jgi:ABC-type sugar transport system ATPase subunit
VIRAESLSVRAGGFALHDVSFEVPDRCYAVLMGRTGSGKTTLLETLCGLRHAHAGRILLCDRDVTGLPPALREVGYVPQDAALFATQTVREHLAFALRVRRRSNDAIEKRVAELAELLQLRPLLDRRPAGLSGGERQRVALGRALAFGPRVLLLDEPLSALDELVRDEMQRVLRQARDFSGATVLHVTHSRREADALAEVVLRLEEGRVAPYASQP